MSSQFQPYLESIRAAYEKWWQLYTLTDAVGKQRQVQQVSPTFDFGLMVQMVKKEERREEETIERLPVLEGIRKYAEQHVLLVGRPGSGKSTALARLMLEEATTPQARIPVLVELRYWQGSIEQLIRDSLIRHELVSELIEEALKRSLILFDGVNELPSEEARSQLSAFRRNHPKLPMIFTTRDLSLGGDLGIEKKLEMQPLTEAQMQAFIRAYVPEQAEAMLRQLRDRLQEFGQTPLLLWMLCEVIQQTPDSTFRNLGEIFRVFTETYEQSSLRKHEVAALKGDVKPLSEHRLWKKALKALAFFMMQGETPVDFRVVIHRNAAELELSRVFPDEPFPVRDILDDLLKYHLLQNRSSDELEFRHQMIQEYYAAEALLVRLENLEIDDEQLKREFLNFLKWTESISLMLALVNEVQAIQVVKLALEVDWMLGARLAGKVNQEYHDKTLALVTDLNASKALKVRLLDEMRSEIALEELHIALEDEETLLLSLEALGRIGSDKAICKISEIVDGKPSHIQLLSIRTLERVGSRGAIAELYKIASTADSEIKREIDRTLERLGVKSTATSSSQHTKRKTVRRSRAPKVSAREKLERFAEMLKQQDPETVINVLSTTLYEDDFQETEALVLGLLGCERVVPQLIHALENDEESIRELAVLALSKIGTPDAIDGVIQALEDEDIFEIAAEVLIQLANELALPGLLQLLEIEYLDTDFYRRVAKAVLKIESEDAVEGLSQALQHENFDISWAVADVLKASGKERLASRELFEKMKDIDYYERCQAAIVLGYLGEVRAIPTLITAIDYAVHYDDFELCWKAIYVLRKFSDHPIAMSISELAAPSLTELILEGGFGDAKAEAIKTLGSLSSPQKLPEFWQHLSSSLEFLSVIKAIQKKWKFYSYEIAQAYLEAQKNDRQIPQNNDRPPLTQNFFGSINTVIGNAENLFPPPSDSVE